MARTSSLSLQGWDGINERKRLLRVVTAAAVFHEIAARACEIARSATLSGDLRGAIDALGRQAAAAESYSRIAEAQKAVANAPEPVWKNGELNPDALQSSMTIADFDAVIEQTITKTHPHLDFSKSCPFCDQLGMPRAISETMKKPDLASGQESGQV